MWEKIKLITKLLFSSIGGHVWSAVKLYLKSYGPILAKVAGEAVLQVAKSAIAGQSGEDKRKEAFNIITNSLTTAGIQVGIQVGTSEINKAIEDAYQIIKDNA